MALASARMLCECSLCVTTVPAHRALPQTSSTTSTAACVNWSDIYCRLKGRGGKYAENEMPKGQTGRELAVQYRLKAHELLHHEANSG